MLILNTKPKKRKKTLRKLRPISFINIDVQQNISKPNLATCKKDFIPFIPECKIGLTYEN